MDEESSDFPDSGESSMQVRCSVGSFLQLDCNKLSYTSSTDIIGIDNEHFTGEEMELLVWGSGIVLSKRSNICSHHKEMFLTRYEQQTRICYDPFKVHKGVIKKNFRVISLQFAKRIQINLDLNITPGLKLCCKEINGRITKINENRELEDNISDDSPLYNLPSTSTKTNMESARDKFEKNNLNISLGAIGVSPLKLHSIPTHSRTAIGKRKLKKAQTHLGSKISSALKLSKSSKLHTEPSDSDSELTKSVLQQKADDLDFMVQLIKNKIPEVNKREKIQILSFTPRSWSRETAAEHFGVSEYMVRQAHLLTDSFGICILPQAKHGRKINVATASLVENFYQDDEYSRQLSGSKDYAEHFFSPASRDWDDRELISLFMDKAERKKVMKRRKENMIKNILSRTNIFEVKTKKNSKRDDARKNSDSSSSVDDEIEIEWKVSDYCRAMFSEDEFFYEAVIMEIVDEDTFKVKFIGYNNEELVKRDYMLKSKGEKAQKIQEEDAAKWWSIGDYCCALYEGDRKWYEAKIIDFDDDDDDDVCAVQFIGYNEVEYVYALRPTRGRTARHLQKQIARVRQEGEWNCSYGEDDHSSHNSSRSDHSSIKVSKQAKSEKHCCCLPRAKPERCAPQTACCKNASSGCIKRNSLSQIHVPTDVPFIQHAVSDNRQNESLRQLLISWYMAGCHTGFYQGQKERSRCTCCH